MIHKISRTGQQCFYQRKYVYHHSHRIRYCTWIVLPGASNEVSTVPAKRKEFLAGTLPTLLEAPYIARRNSDGHVKFIIEIIVQNGKDKRFTKYFIDCCDFSLQIVLICSYKGGNNVYCWVDQLLRIIADAKYLSNESMVHRLFHLVECNLMRANPSRLLFCDCNPSVKLPYS